MPSTVDAGTIQRLPQALINQIAAGEVVSRPASAVKELVENSLDAGATRIEIAVEEDARSFTIRDDGCGMNAADARLALERHATSKIRDFDDLHHLTTRGFRGEALAAIAGISRFELLTRREADDAGLQVRCEGGRELRDTASGAPPGTLITVRDLFYNTPARLKFLRSPTVEWGHILKAVIRQALARPDVAFNIRWRGRPYLNLPGGQALRERLLEILPNSRELELLEIDETVHGVRAWGCIGSPKSTRRDRRHQYYFANGRPIAARPLTFALQEAYRGLIMTQQFPVAAVFLELPGEELDVNVHPTKEEVRFRNESLAAGSIHRAALAALRKADLVPRFEWTGRGEGDGKSKAPETSPPVFFPKEAVRSGQAGQASSGGTASPPTEASFVNADGKTGTASMPAAEAEVPARDAAETPARPAASSEEAYADENAQREASLIERLRESGVQPRLLGQVLQTYILAEAPGHGLLLIDQHAAHEKILYLKFRAQEGRRDIQNLLVPYTIEASPAGVAAMEALIPALNAEGFETEHFGGNTFVVQSVPLVFDRLNVEKFLKELAEEISPAELNREIETLRHRIGASAACRAAVMAGDHLNAAEMQAILDDVLETAEALRCPHGRPTMLLLTRDQLDRQFGRI